MNFIDSILMAVRSIRANKTRSALTMLGVVIGIAAVIVLVAIGEAAKLYVVAQVESWGMGPNVMQINPGKNQGDMSAYLDNKIKYKHAMIIAGRCPSVSEVVPIVSGTAKARYGKREYRINQAWGTTDNYQKVFNHKIVSGRFFTKGEMDGSRKVVILGKKVAKELLGNFDPVGEKIKINGRKYTVIGLFAEKGKMLTFDMDDIAVLPIFSAMSLFNTKGVIEIDIAAKTQELVPKAIDEIDRALETELAKDDYHITTQEGMMNMLNNIIGMLTTIIGGIAAISLLVGGIGIMNIMLVSVTERTKEIGIRKAVGAKKTDIFIQFLVESVVFRRAAGDRPGTSGNVRDNVCDKTRDGCGHLGAHTGMQRFCRYRSSLGCLSGDESGEPGPYRCAEIRIKKVIPRTF
ncbi:MAG: ABC transporter permease [Candidatus Saganbacteria bacterium]|nr:ABC transporter permease [Candidatus Saganbacteria bacterium]